MEKNGQQPRDAQSPRMPSPGTRHPLDSRDVLVVDREAWWSGGESGPEEWDGKGSVELVKSLVKSGKTSWSMETRL